MKVSKKMEKIEYRSDNRNIIKAIENLTEEYNVEVPPWGLTVHEYMLVYKKLYLLGVNKKLMKEKLDYLDTIRPDDENRLNYVIQP